MKIKTKIPGVAGKTQREIDPREHREAESRMQGCAQARTPQDASGARSHPGSASAAALVLLRAEARGASTIERHAPKRNLTVSLALAILLFMLAFLAAGCASGPGVEWQVENVKQKEGANLLPLRNEILKDAKENIAIWITSPDRIEEAFTGTALNEFRAARDLDKKEGVRVVRVHKNQRFTVFDVNDGIRPQVEYRFLDMTYYVDARTGKPKTKPFNKERTISLFLVRADGKFKIDNMIGSREAIR